MVSLEDFIFLPYIIKKKNLVALMALADEFEELDTQRERFYLERNHRARHQRELPQEVPGWHRKPVEEQQQQKRTGPYAARFCAEPSTSLPQMRWPEKSIFAGPAVQGMRNAATDRETPSDPSLRGATRVPKLQPLKIEAPPQCS